MTVLSEIVRNVLVIVIVASFLEMLLPEGSMRPMARFALGLFILIAVLNPFLGELFKERNFEIGWWDYQAPKEVDAAQVETGGKQIQQQLRQAQDSLVVEKVEGQVSSIAMLVPGVSEVQTRAQLNPSGGVEKLHLRVKLESGSTEDTKDKGDTEDQEKPVKAFSEKKSGISQTEQNQIRNKMVNLVHSFYNCKENDVEIEFEGG